MFITDSFSLNMLDAQTRQQVNIFPVDADFVRAIKHEYGLQSAVGHSATARILSSQLGIKVPHRRIDIKLLPSREGIIVAQAQPEAEVNYWFVYVGTSIAYRGGHNKGMIVRNENFPLVKKIMEDADWQLHSNTTDAGTSIDPMPTYVMQDIQVLYKLAAFITSNAKIIMEMTTSPMVWLHLTYDGKGGVSEKVTEFGRF